MVTLRKDVQYGHYFNDQGVRIVERDYDPNELLNVSQVASELGVTEDWVRKLIRRDKKLIATQLGRAYIIRRKDLEEYRRNQNTE